ncbi:SCA7-domain-containing protein [Trichodelitschia bisporula]|uniref:SCA7-domain-containing protein n=1 Tax=Trichodelitschia bisporula TaxID=703511 RepID=A0A6G1HI50_9PEZI|nr:SCA7-domain-containing protein [Trichodelitschia bisporula]
MADQPSSSEPKKERFTPKTPVTLAPPKDDPIELDHLAKCDGTNEGFPTLVAIKGTVFDVTGNASYAPGKNYNVFCGKDASRALALSSLKPEDCVPNWEDLDDTAKKTLDDWFTFFSKRYNVVGRVAAGKEGQEEPEAEVPESKGPVDIEKQCGVLLTNGSQCPHSSTCKSHSWGAKRAVQGRSAPFDVLLQQHQEE